MQVTFRELAELIENLPTRNRQKLIGIDGGTNAGKSSFTGNIQKQLTVSSHHIWQESFYKGFPSGKADPVHRVTADYDWDRLERQVFEPLRQGQQITYQELDWNTRSLGGWVTVQRDAIIMFDGIQSTQTRFRELYDLRIWVDHPDHLRLERGVRREGEHMRQTFAESWIPFDEYYRTTHRTREYADLVVSGEFTDTSFELISQPLLRTLTPVRAL